MSPLACRMATQCVAHDESFRLRLSTRTLLDAPATVDSVRLCATLIVQASPRATSSSELTLASKKRAYAVIDALAKAPSTLAERACVHVCSSGNGWWSRGFCQRYWYIGEQMQPPLQLKCNAPCSRRQLRR